MNAFANPEDATLFEYPEFPAPERAVVDFANDPRMAATGFRDFQTVQKEGQDESATLVQPVRLQDFKEVTSATP
jgi:hypothetical protein